MEKMTLVVSAVDDEVPGIRTVTLKSTDNDILPSFTPGSHIILECGSVANAYSLTGESVYPDHYSISVLEVPEGAGGSTWVHRQLTVGDVVAGRPPRSAFAPIQRADKHLLVAAGIGITPMISHLRSAVTWNREFELMYVFKSGRGAYLDEIVALAGDRARFFTDRASFGKALGESLDSQPIGTHLYTCGPSNFMEAVCESATALGWPQSRVHLEHFGVAALDPGDPFEVTISGTQEAFTVAPGVSLLEALEQRGYQIPNLCRQGVCGECRIPVAQGKVLHRDLFLSDEEKSTHQSMMCCVSRAADNHVEVTV